MFLGKVKGDDLTVAVVSGDDLLVFVEGGDDLTVVVEGRDNSGRGGERQQWSWRVETT